jgi:uncharacterized protein with PIN domain
MVVMLALEVPADLRFLLPPARRRGSVYVEAAETDTVGHVVSSVGIPLTEVGCTLLEGVVAPASARVAGGRLVIMSIPRPQSAPTSPPRFLLDVHLGGLARRLRILGLDAAYHPDADDPDLVQQAVAEQRVLLTQDRGLLRRRAVSVGALVRGAGTAAQLDDVLDRFAPPLAPWTRCTSCGGPLERATWEDVAARLEPGTRQTYREFARCRECGRVYWRGAHRARLDRVVAHAEEIVRARRNGLQPSRSDPGA